MEEGLLEGIGDVQEGAIEAALVDNLLMMTWSWVGRERWQWACYGRDRGGR